MREYDRAWLSSDLVAGITLAAVAIPECMGYTKIAGTPIVTGLYTILLPLAVFGLLGSSRHLVVGADSATAAMLFAGLAGHAEPFSGHWVMLSSAAALLTAALLAAAAVLRLGFLADFLSRTVLVGFLSGVGLSLVIGQLPEMLGIPVHADGSVSRVIALVTHASQVHVPTVLMAVGVLAVIVAVERVARHAPGALIALALAIAASWVFRLDHIGIAVVGPVQAGLPPVQVPRAALGEIALLLPTAASMFLVVVAQSAATARSFAQRNAERLDQNRDFFALAVSNAVAGFTNAFVVNGSPTKTAIAAAAGARTQVAQLTTAVVVLIVLLVATPLIAPLPVASLGALVFLVGITLVDVDSFRHIFRFRKVTFLVALGTMIAVVLVGVERGMLLAVVLSVLDHLHQEYRPKDIVLTTSPGGLRPTRASPGVESTPGLLVYRFEAPLFFANADHFSARVEELIHHAPHPVKWFVFDLVSMDDIDYTGGLALVTTIKRLRMQGVCVAFAETEDVRQTLEWLESNLQVEPVRVFESVQASLDAYAREIGSPS